MKLTVKKLQEAIRNEIKSYLMEQLETKQISDREVYDEAFIPKYGDELKAAFNGPYSIDLSPHQKAAVKIALLLNEEYMSFRGTNVSLSGNKLEISSADDFVSFLDMMVNMSELTDQFGSEFDLGVALDGTDEYDETLAGDVYRILSKLTNNPMLSSDEAISVLVGFEEEEHAEIVEKLLSKVGYEVV